MANTNDLPHADKHNILLVGDSGTGKTTLAGSFPSPFFFDFDFRMSALRGKDVNFDSFRDAMPGRPAAPERGMYTYGQAYPAMLVRLNKLVDEIDEGKSPYKTIVFDSMTLLAECAMMRVLQMTNTDKAHQGSYGDQIGMLKKLVSQVTALPVNIIITAHVQRQENAVTNVTEMLPLVTGKFAGLLPAFFDETWYTDVRRAPSKPPEYIIKTVSSQSIRQAKTTLGIPNDTIADYTKLAPYLNGVSKP